LRAELAGLRDALQGGSAQPAAGGDGRALHDGRWDLVGHQDGASTAPS
jgi:hypothetical protein